MCEPEKKADSKHTYNTYNSQFVVLRKFSSSGSTVGHTHTQTRVHVAKKKGLNFTYALVVDKLYVYYIYTIYVVTNQNF